MDNKSCGHDLRIFNKQGELLQTLTDCPWCNPKREEKVVIVNGVDKPIRYVNTFEDRTDHMKNLKCGDLDPDKSEHEEKPKCGCSSGIRGKNCLDYHYEEKPSAERYSYEELKKLPRHAELMKWDKSDLAAHSIKYQSLYGDLYQERLAWENEKAQKLIAIDYLSGANAELNRKDEKIVELENKVAEAESDLKWYAEVHEPEAIKLATEDLEKKVAHLTDLLKTSKNLRLSPEQIQMDKMRAKVAILEKRVAELETLLRSTNNDKAFWQDRIAELEAELKEYSDDREKVFKEACSLEYQKDDRTHCTCVPALRTIIKTIQSKLDEAVKALEKYGHHIVGCNHIQNYIKDNRASCNCGLDEALRKIKEM